MTQNTRTGCAPNGGSSNRSVNFNSVSHDINDDVLTCYLTNTSTSLVSTSPRTATPVASCSTPTSSSRRASSGCRCWKIQPANGGSQTYSIIDFGAAFLTDETATTNATKGSKTGTNSNGVVVQGKDIKQLKVIFFNDDSIPIDGDIPLIDYLGSGQPCHPPDRLTRHASVSDLFPLSPRPPPTTIAPSDPPQEPTARASTKSRPTWGDTPHLRSVVKGLDSRLGHISL